MSKKLLLTLNIFLFLSLASILRPRQLAESANLTAAKDTMDTSRSSWRTTLAAASSAGNTSFKLTSIAGILPGDVIKLWEGTPETLIINAIDTPSSRVTTTTAAASAHADNGDVTGGFGYDPATDVGGTIAYHTITFLPTASAIDGGEVRITFPADTSTTDANDGEPDTAGFDFNGIGDTYPGSNFTCTGGGTAGWGGETAATMSASGYGIFVFPFRKTLSDSTVTCTLGSTTRATGTHLINPAKTASSGTADTWSVTLETRAAPDYNVVDSVILRIATVESVRVTATVSPTLTVILAGTANATSVCGETTNSGTASTATLVPLGTLSDSALNVNAQNVTVATNGRDGYTMVVKDNGYLKNNSGDNIDYHRVLTDNDTPAPTVLNSTGTEAYGLHACGTHVNTTDWGAGTGATVNLYGASGSGTAWQYYRTLVSYTAPCSQTVTNVMYKATISGTTPAGNYEHAVTYVVTATF